MTRIPYDQANKQLLASALGEVGRVDVQHEVSTEPRWVDAWFEPEHVSDEFAKRAGVLGRMVRQCCAFEVFHASVGVEQALECLSKQLDVYVRGKTKEPPYAVPPMWIVCTHRPGRAIRDLAFIAATDWPGGFYRLPQQAVPLYLVVLSEVVQARDTLLLRLLGGGRVLREALEELRALHVDAWERRVAAPLIDVLRSIPRSGAWNDLEEEAIVTTAFKTYEDIINEGRRDGLKRGRKEGLDDGLRRGLDDGLRKGRRTTLVDAVLTVLRSRGLEVPELVERTVANATTEQLERWIAVAATVPTADALLDE